MPEVKLNGKLFREIREIREIREFSDAPIPKFIKLTKFSKMAKSQKIYCRELQKCAEKIEVVSGS